MLKSCSKAPELVETGEQTMKATTGTPCGESFALPLAVRRISRRPWAVASMLAAASLALSISVSFARWPHPQIQDEFSYLLAADTFCEGRLTNPAHPHWEYFETFHVIQQPSYASKYPPGQGAFLALGQVLTGEPLAGVWLLSALATVACYWMLLGWASPRWAMLGGAVFLVHPGYHLVWGQSFWGGTLALLGGALVFGAALRIIRRSEVRDGVVMATGAVLLAASRPFEGMVFCLLIGAWVLLRWARTGIPSTWQALALKTVLPQAAILFVGAWGMARYNQAVTGDLLTLPYEVHEEQYGQTPLFLGQSPVQRTYRHEIIEKFHSGWSMDWYRKQDSLAGVLKTKRQMTRFAAAFFVPSLFALPLLALLLRPKLWMSGRLRPPLAIGGLTFLVSLACLWNFPHYIAPLAPMLLIAVVAGLRYVDVLGRRRIGAFPYAEALVGLQACLFLAAAVNLSAAPIGGWRDQRAQIVKELEASPDRHLIFVRYSPDHDTNQEWVYNRADVDHSKVVWAREMNPASDRELMRYFADRKVWLLEADRQRMQKLRHDDSAIASSGSLPLAGKAGEGVTP